MTNSITLPHREGQGVGSNSITLPHREGQGVGSPAESRFLLACPLQLQATGDRTQYRARLIRAGRIRAQGNRDSNLLIPADVLRSYTHLFSSRPTFVDHPGFWEDYPSLRNLAGITLTDAAWDDEAQGITATIRLYDTEAGQIVADLFSQVLEDGIAGDPVPDIGLSAVLWPKWVRQEMFADESLWAMAEIRHVESVDFVFEPGADGRVQSALAALRLRAKAEASQLQIFERSIFTMPEETTTQSPETPANQLPAPATLSQGWLDAFRQTAADAMIQTSGLPAMAQARLRSQSFTTPADVESAIQSERDYLASLVADQVVQVGSTPPRSPQITVGRTSLEQLESAFEALVLGVQPPSGVQPLSGVRELYHHLSGDYEMHGLFQPDRLALANVTSSTMANLVANVLNKVVVNSFQQYPRWWDPIVSVEDFATMQQIKWITLGGIGELPTVAEGAAYTELTWDDAAETSDFVKKGGYLGITLEAIDKDDTRRVRLAPRALAQAAWLTLSKSVSAIFTTASGAGPTLADTGTLFNATAVTATGGHANLGTSALTWSTYQTGRLAMMKQAEVNSGERLGFLTAPRYILVPVDLEITALQLLASEGEPGTGDNDVNPLASGDSRESRLSAARRRVIVVPLWTDANDWALAADPQLYPSIGLGFRYGRTPEIFSVASPTAGLMFTNDTMPVKVRFFYAVGPTDYRGLYKANVT